MEFKNQQLRVPPMFDKKLKTRIKVEIPQGTELFLADLHNKYEEGAKTWNGGVRFNAHLGLFGMAPFNTMPAFELAARCGFPACVANPRTTKDGKFVCIHDETINDTARDENGNPPKEPLYVRDMTYEELLKWDFGIHKSKLYKGTHIPLLEDFFMLCSKTGMHPMFSTHQKFSIEEWKKIRFLLKKHRILHLFHMKSFYLDILEDAYSVFGDEIDGYTWDEGNAESFKKSILNKTTKRLVLERISAHTTPEIIREDREAGFETATQLYEMDKFLGEDYERYIKLGVSEFVEDFHCSMGLNW